MATKLRDAAGDLPLPWIAAAAAPFAALLGGLLLQPDLFYDRFLWKYFYGPIVADAQNVASVTRNGVTATPGYTLVSEAGYAYTILVAVVGVVYLLRRFDIGNSPRFYYGLVPYIFLGGAFRVVEDTGVLEWPLSFFVISPVIYFTVFLATAAVLLAALALQRRGVVDDYAPAFAAVGVAAFLAVAAFLLNYGVTESVVLWWVPVAVLGLATLTSAVLWFPVTQYVPAVTAGTGWMGAVLLWGHQVDGWATAIGIEVLGYGEKHPVAQAIIDLSGTTYTFVAVKAALVILILYAFDEEFFSDYERLPYLLLVTMLAVGLGPGTRNFLRATIGV